MLDEHEISELRVGNQVKIRRFLSKSTIGEVTSISGYEKVDDWGIDYEGHFINVRLDTGKIIKVDSKKVFGKYEILKIV